MIGHEASTGLADEKSFSCDEALALLAHDLRTSIMVIHGFATTLSRSDGDLSEVQRGFALTAIGRHAEGLLAFSQDILDIASAQDGKLTLAREPVDLGASARAVADRVRTDYPAHRMCIDVEPTHLLAIGDERRIGQVIENFLRNAGRYSPPGTRIDVAVRRGPDCVGVTVYDGGPPLPPDVAADPFGKRGPRPDRGGGAGLGLYLCRLIVESLGGRVWAESGDGGVTFGFVLPVAG